MDCLFCKIANKEIPSDLIYEDKYVVAFKDINPQAPVHFLVVPKVHIRSLDYLNEDQNYLISHIFKLIPSLTKEQGVENGYRVVNNCGPEGGQTVDHIHFHVLGKREMLWPPG
ncbi:histidine triad nucleotide-binding protein [Gudongella sp. DL1XJH-153]|uniref:histidine triad nucleotide-binding protein n=1 Tax=Gudongella sp. DL1XJH-153 TaxID=3409804 RepID=UPI003BB78FBB